LAAHELGHRLPALERQASDLGKRVHSPYREKIISG
jgi:hypothetical protein